MHYRKLERFLKEYPSLRERFLHFDEFLWKHRNETPNLEIVPQLLAKRLGIDRGLALSFLEVAEELDILKHRFDVYCRESGEFLESFYDEVPERIYCIYHDDVHDEDGIRVDLVYQFSDMFTSNRASVVNG